MTDASFQRIRRLIDELQELSPEARTARLEELGEQSLELRDEVESLLRHVAHPVEALETPVMAEGSGWIDRLVDSAKPPGMPEQVGRYRILSRVGAGGMGVVYLAEQDSPQRTVALKMMRGGLVTPNLLRRFRREVELLGRLTHPGIAQIYDAGTVDLGDGEQPFFAMELVEGRPLTEYAHARSLGTRAKLELFVRVCEAVQHAHTRGVIHRDLKPDNVLVGEGDVGQPKVLDFGIARATDSDVQVTTLQTDVGQLVGTLPYMSPEQVAGDTRELDARSDVYALGAILYELLTGDLPLDLSTCSVPEAARMIQEDNPRTLSSFHTAFRGDLDTIVAKALEKEPDRRYETAEALAADVTSFLTSQPIRARPQSTFYQVQKLIRRHRGFSAGLALALVALIAGLLVAVRFGVEEARQRRETERTNYRLTIMGAATALGVENVNEVAGLLESAQPELLGWEWGYLGAEIERHLWEVPCQPVSAGKEHHDVCFSRDGAHVVAVTDATTIKVFDAPTGNQSRMLEDEAGWVPWALAASEETLAAATFDHRLRVFHLATGAELHAQRFEEPIVALEWGASGERLVVALGDDKGLTALFTGPPSDLERGPAPSGGGSSSFHRSQRAGKVAFCFPGSAAGHVVDANTGEAHRLPGRTQPWGPYNCVAYDPDRGLFLAGSSSKSVWVWRHAATGGELVLEREYLGHTGRSIRGVALSADGEHAATLAASAALRVWNLSTGALRVVHPVEGRGAVDLDPTGRFLAARDGARLRVWSLDTERGRKLEGHPTYVYDLEFSPDGRTIASRDWEFSVRLWDSRDGRPLGSLPGTSGQQRLRARRPFGFSMDGTQLFTVIEDGRLHAADVATDGEFLPVADAAVPEILGPRRWAEAVGGPRSSNNLVFSPDGAWAAEVPFHEVLDARSGEVVSTLGPALHRYEHSNTDASFSPDGRVAVAWPDGVRVHDVATGELLRELEGHVDTVYTVAWSPDGSRLATGSNDHTIRIWHVETGETLLVLYGHESYVHDVAWSPDGTQLASASGDGSVRLWDSLPAAHRYSEARAAADLRAELRPHVVALLDELDDVRAVAAELRADTDLNDERRHEALRVLRELAVP